MTLSQRLLDAADAIEEFNASLPNIYTADAEWGPSGLRLEAGHLADEEAVIAELAYDLFHGSKPENTPALWSVLDKRFYLRVAKAAILAGWRKP